MPTTGKIYLGETLVSDPDAGGSTVEYVTLTFSGGNTFGVSALTDNGYVDTTINGSGSVNVVKDSIVLVGKKWVSLSQSTTPSQSNLRLPIINGAASVDSPFTTGAPTTIPNSNWVHLLIVVANQDITFYADED